jgi:hypothetical protein
MYNDLSGSSFFRPDIGVLRVARFAQASDFEALPTRDSELLLSSGDCPRTPRAFAGASPAYVFFVQRGVELTSASRVEQRAVKFGELRARGPLPAQAAVCHVFWVFVVGGVVGSHHVFFGGPSAAGFK